MILFKIIEIKSKLACFPVIKTITLIVKNILKTTTQSRFGSTNLGLPLINEIITR